MAEIKYVDQIGLSSVFKITNGWIVAAKSAAVSESKSYTDNAIAGLTVYKAGTGISIGADGTISVTGDATVNPDALPVASKTQLGAIKVGDGFTVAEGGVLSVAFPDCYTKSESDAAIAAAVKAGVDGLVDGASDAMNTFKEIEEYIAEHAEVVTMLNEAIGKKANAADVYTKTEANEAIGAATANFATVEDVATAKSEAVTAAATDAAGKYVAKTDMPTFVAYTAEEIQALADAVVAGDE